MFEFENEVDVRFSPGAHVTVGCPSRALGGAFVVGMLLGLAIAALGTLVARRRMQHRRVHDLATMRPDPLAS